MKIVFFGDSITDGQRNREEQEYNARYGSGFVIQVVSRLFRKDPKKYEILNRGIGGDRIVDMIARIKKDVWNEQPDVVSILEGINDISHEVYLQNGVDVVRWEKLYRMMLADTKERLPNTKLIICEPFALCESRKTDDVLKYAQETQKIAQEFNLPFVALQDKMDKAVNVYGVEACCLKTLSQASEITLLPTRFGCTPS